MHHHKPGHHHHDRGSHGHAGARQFARATLLGARERPGRHGRGGGRHRRFGQADRRLLLLGMIASKPAHGYDLVKVLEERPGGGYGPETVYPTLTLLEEQGFVSVTAEDGKRLYQATAEGEAFLRANQDAMVTAQARIGATVRHCAGKTPGHHRLGLS